MPIDLTPAAVREHLEHFVPPRPPEMQAMEAYARAHHFPIIGPVAGYLCYQVARLIQARQVFELGSGYGYSTAWFAQAVRENGGGTVHHVVWDEGLSQMARKHLTALGLADLVQFHVGEAVQTLRDTPGPFDLIFNDIDKDAYPTSLPVIHGKLRSGGALIVDNMLWSGRIFDANDQSPDTQGVRELTRLMRTDVGWIATIIPIRDGVLLAYKK
jgi:predicted O-methyltransferase YrrM